MLAASSLAWKEEPQPQAATTFGLLTWKAGALQAFDVVDLGAEDELHADPVDDDRDVTDLEDAIVLLGAVEGERVLEARAAPPRTATRSAWIGSALKIKPILTLVEEISRRARPYPRPLDGASARLRPASAMRQASTLWVILHCVAA